MASLPVNTSSESLAEMVSTAATTSCVDVVDAVRVKTEQQSDVLPQMVPPNPAVVPAVAHAPDVLDGASEQDNDLTKWLQQNKLSFACKDVTELRTFSTPYALANNDVVMNTVRTKMKPIPFKKLKAALLALPPQHVPSAVLGECSLHGIQCSNSYCDSCLYYRRCS